jgi:hypothetical protein
MSHVRELSPWGLAFWRALSQENPMDLFQKREREGERRGEERGGEERERKKKEKERSKKVGSKP